MGCSFFRASPGICGKHTASFSPVLMACMPVQSHEPREPRSCSHSPTRSQEPPTTSNTRRYFYDYREKLALQLQLACCLWSAGDSHVTLHISYLPVLMAMPTSVPGVDFAPTPTLFEGHRLSGGGGKRSSPALGDSTPLCEALPSLRLTCSLDHSPSGP